VSDASSIQFENYVLSRGGTRLIRKILIANNGLGAVKAIRSLRLWEYETFRTHDILHIVCMATEDDLKANAEYIRLADEFVTVESGSNRNNYANVDLIVKVARRCEADAVWPGWGHASENPKLPAALAYHDIAFLGPSAESMDAVGDKICANLLAQSCDVNVIPWSGSGLTVPDITIPEDILLEATLATVEEAEASAMKIGFPLMVKASEGGGGKGIRMVSNMDELRTGFVQVQAEVPGSPIFIQQLSTGTRSRCTAATAACSDGTRRSSRKAPSPSRRARRAKSSNAAP
jgi:acetyl-CoA carboxylase/biotin carboxylase 1